jgi:hypothetical protein
VVVGEAAGGGSTGCRERAAAVDLMGEYARAASGEGGGAWGREEAPEVWGVGSGGRTGEVRCGGHAVEVRCGGASQFDSRERKST